MKLEESINLLESSLYDKEIDTAIKVVLVELKKLMKLNELNEEIINILKFKVEILEQKINSFESGEMIRGKRYE